MSRRETRIDSALSHNLKGEVSREDCKKNNIAFWQIFIFYKYTRLTYGILCRKDKKKVKKQKMNQHDSKNGRDSKCQSVIRTSPCMINVLKNTQGKWHNSISLVYAIKCILKKKSKKNFKVNSYMSWNNVQKPISWILILMSLLLASQSSDV